MNRPLRIAVLVKQVPKFESFELGPDGRLVREGLELEMNPYCRRAVAKGVELGAQTGGRTTVVTLGPPSAEDCLREAIACGADDGVLLTDPAFAGSDTLATARALAAALRVLGPFDLIMCGRNSVDADTGQTPAEIAELLDLPFAGGVRELEVVGDTVDVRCEHDDGWLTASLPLPAFVSCAERLCAPAKATPEARATVQADRVRRLPLADLGEGPWGAAGSPTVVGRVQRLAVDRLRLRLEGDPAQQVAKALEVIAERGGFAPAPQLEASSVPPPPPMPAGPVVTVVVEPGRDRVTRELLGAAAQLAAAIGGSVVALTSSDVDHEQMGAWGADTIVPVTGVEVEEDMAAALVASSIAREPWAVLAAGTMWGREVLGRSAAGLRAGLVGDAVDLDVDGGRLVCWKPAFGGGLVAAVTCTSSIQMATVRPGVLPVLESRQARPVVGETVVVIPRRRVTVHERSRDDDIEVLATASAIVAVGTGVHPDEYPALQPLLGVLEADLACTRRVTDDGSLPRSRQVGITGRSVSPRLYVALGVAGKFNHLVGARGAGVIVAVNNDPTAPIFDGADVGFVADWRDIVALLVPALEARRSQSEPGRPAVARAV